MISNPHEVEYPQRSDRRPVDLKGFAMHPWGDATSLNVANLSYEGCEVRSAHPLRFGDRFELRVSRLGAIQAEVRWSARNRAGCKFIYH
jgi:hypothetical protein